MGTALTDADFVGANEGLTKAQMTALFVSQGNFETYMDAGNGVNLLAVQS